MAATLAPTPITATIAPEFLLQRQGRTMVLYAGLLDAAHRTAGLKSLKTTLLQAPSDGNGQTCIVGAEATTEDGRTFCGIGDASPQNVGPKIGPHAIRMAETRAKARCLRDLLNVGGYCSVEELND